MILDTSAVIALIRDEQEADGLLRKMEDAHSIGIGTPTLLEATVVLVRRNGPSGRAALAQFVEEQNVASLPFDGRHWNVAAKAFIQFGKSRHPARLNLIAPA